jgi:beta-mannosidase
LCGVGAGTFYEDHAFFDICDESGILVWQDFSLACAIYPQTDEFAKIIEREAAAAVVKLRNHPSILLWSGDNEVDAMYYNFGYDLPHVRNNRLSREVLRAWRHHMTHSASFCRPRHIFRSQCRAI